MGFVGGVCGWDAGASGLVVPGGVGRRCRSRVLPSKVQYWGSRCAGVAESGVAQSAVGDRGGVDAVAGEGPLGDA